MFTSLGAAVLKATGKRTHAPIRRHSKPAGQCETTIWRRTDRADVRKIVLAAKRYEVANKPAGSRKGPLGAVALEVLELLANLVDYKTGRLEPSIDTIMRKVRRSRDAVVRALQALRQHGFVDWLRRFVPVEDAEGRKGPQVKQTSNAYRLSLPERAKALLGRYGTPAPLPEDREQADAERAAQLAEYAPAGVAAQLELLEAADGGNPVLRSLARLGRNLLKQRESVKRTESGSESIYKRE